MKYLLAAVALCVATSAASLTFSGTLTEPGQQLSEGTSLGAGNYTLRWAFDRPFSDTEWGTPEELIISYDLWWYGEQIIDGEGPGYSSGDERYSFTPLSQIGVAAITVPQTEVDIGENYSFTRTWFLELVSIEAIELSGPIGVTLWIEDAGVGVPEPSTWALFIGGFGLIGAALRRQRLPRTQTH